MEISYLKAHSLGKCYPKWMPNLPSNHGQDSNPCAWGSLGPYSARGSTVAPQPLSYLLKFPIHSPLTPYIHSISESSLSYRLLLSLALS